MAEKSLPKSNNKKQGKSLQEKRSAKQAKKAEKSKRSSTS
jgi:hypothetical protein